MITYVTVVGYLVPASQCASSHPWIRRAISVRAAPLERSSFDVEMSDPSGCSIGLYWSDVVRWPTAAITRSWSMRRLVPFPVHDE